MSTSLIKRSSVHHVQQAHHARFVTKHGWEIAGSFGHVEMETTAARERVVLVDESWLGKLECKGDWVATLKGMGIPNAAYYQLIPTHGIWIVQPQGMIVAKQTLEAKRAAAPRSYLIDNSSYYASFRLVGPAAAEVLCKLSSAQVAVGGHTQATVASVHCLIIRNEQGYQFHFGREFGEYMWECFLDAGEEFGIAASGVEVLNL